MAAPCTERYLEKGPKFALRHDERLYGETSVTDSTAAATAAATTEGVAKGGQCFNELQP